MIVPTVGRVVLYHPLGITDGQPCAAIVCYVHSDRLVNLSWFNHNGEQEKALTVTLVQEGDTIGTGPYACWMPYQIGQSKK